GVRTQNSELRTQSLVVLPIGSPGGEGRGAVCFRTASGRGKKRSISSIVALVCAAAGPRLITHDRNVPSNERNTLLSTPRTRDEASGFEASAINLDTTSVCSSIRIAAWY